MTKTLLAGYENIAAIILLNTFLLTVTRRVMRLITPGYGNKKETARGLCKEAFEYFFAFLSAKLNAFKVN